MTSVPCAEEIVHGRPAQEAGCLTPEVIDQASQAAEQIALIASPCIFTLFSVSTKNRSLSAMAHAAETEA